MATNLTELDAVFDANPAAARGLAASYQALLGGVPTVAGFGFLIDTALGTNFGSLRTDIAFNEENIFINLTNNLVQGNAAAAAHFDAMDGGATTLPGKIEAYYKVLVPAEAQTVAGLAFLTRPEALQFYADAAAERSVGGTDGAAVVALASLLKILVTQDLLDLGDDVNDLIAAVGDSSARIGTEGLNDIDIADGAAHDDDERSPTLAIAVTNASPRVNQAVEVTFDFSERVEGFDLSDVRASGGVLSNLRRSADDPTLFTATFRPSEAGPAAIEVGSGYVDADGNAGAESRLQLTVLPPEGQNPETPGEDNTIPVGSPTAMLPNGTEDTPYTVQASDLLAGFSDPDGDPLSVGDLSSSQGTVTDNGDGTYTLSLPANYNGPVTLSYTVQDDNRGVVAASLDVTVDPVNDAPTGSPTAVLANGTEDTPYTVQAADLLAGFSDPDGDPLSVSDLTSSQGSVTDNGDGSYTVTLPTNYNGPVTLSYSVGDGSSAPLAATQSFTVDSVNDAPTGTPIATLPNGTEDRPYTVSAANLLAGFSDPDGDPLSVGDLASSQGTVTDNGDGTYTVALPANYNGPMTLSYTVSDGSSAPLAATQSFTVDPVNDAPTGTPMATLPNGTEDQPYTVSAADLLAGFSDPDGDPLSVDHLTSSHGTVTDNGDGTYTVSFPANYNGAIALTYSVVDGIGGSAPANLGLQVDPVADTPIARVSVDSAENQANGSSDDPLISGNGRYVVFLSEATNLVAGDLNGRIDVFIRDLWDGTTTRFEAPALNGETDGDNPLSIAGDGRYVAFSAFASNLVTGDTNDAADIFLRDLETSTVQRVSLDSEEAEANGSSFHPSISRDGRYVAFESAANNLVADDTNGVRDIFLRDLQTGITTRVSVNGAEVEANGDSLNPSISGNGRYVTFESAADNFVADDTNARSDIFVHDLETGLTTRVSLDSEQAEANGDSYHPLISAGGRHVVFISAASNLVADDTNGVRDVFLRDLETGITTRVSLGSGGLEGSGDSYDASISGDGRYVAFESQADNLVAGDTNGVADIFVRDLQTGRTTRVNVNSDAVQANSFTFDPSISEDGRYVAFRSLANNLVADDTNARPDIFVVDGLDQGWWSI